MGLTAELVAERYKVTRQQQDEYALQSQQRYAAAVESGRVADEITPMTVKWLKEDRKAGTKEILEGTVSKDECNRPQTTLQGLADLKPVFNEDTGTITAGNASQLSDGASMTLLMSEQKAIELGLTP